MFLHVPPYTNAPTALIYTSRDGATAPTYCAAAPCSRFAKDNGLCLFHTAVVACKYSYPVSTQPQTSVSAGPLRHQPNLMLYLPSRASNESVCSGRSSPASDDVRRVVNRKLCRVDPCTKRAKSGGLCIAHGGGKRCDVDGCVKSAKERGFCISHGGGKRCLGEGCNKSALLGGYCAHHGGGRRCGDDNCNKYALSGGYCIAHGGGKRCNFVSCPKSAVSGGFCVAHGGGHRCATAGCMKGAVTGGLCIKHGGGKKCRLTSCRKNARTKGYCFTHFKAMEALAGNDFGGVVEV